MEEQQAESTATRPKVTRLLSPEEWVLQKRKDGLRLARKNIARQLETAHNPNHRKVLEAAMAALDSQMDSLG